jgi:hypothetical protein
VAAIPDTGGARYAPRGMTHVLSRVVLLGGLIVMGWLLGAGTGHADEGLEQSDTGLVQLLKTTQSEGESGGQLSMPPTVTSAVTRALSTVSVRRLPIQPPVRAGVLKPLDQALIVGSANGVLAPVSRPLSGPAKYGAGVRSQAPVERPATIQPAKPTVGAAAATASVPSPASLTALITVNHALPAVAACAAAAPAVGPFTGQSALGDDPVAPVPASPPASTTSPRMIGSTGGGAGTKHTPDVAVNASWATARLVAMHRLLKLSASDLPRSPAAQPSTSPD